MIDKTINTNDKRLRYRNPEIKEIPLAMQKVLCQSNGNESMREVDYGNGGFGEE